MSWAKFDDNYSDHPKVIAVGPLGMALHVAATCYAAKYLTDGFIPKNVINRLISFDGITIDGNVVSNASIVALLIENGLFDNAPGGYMVHDYLKYNPSKEDVLVAREEARQRQERWLAKKKLNNAYKDASQDVSSTEPPSPTPSPTPTSELNNKDILTGFQQLFHLPIDSVDILAEFEDMEKQYPQRFWKVMQWAAGTKPPPSSAKRVLKMVGAAIANWKDEFPKQSNNGHGSDEKIPGVNGRWLEDAGSGELVWFPF